MKRPFLHEHHNRQEKVWKEPGRCPGSDGGQGKPTRVWEQEFKVDWSTDPPTIRSRFRYNEQTDKQQHKEQIARQFSAALQSMRFVVEGYKFKFAYGVREFAQANHLPLAQANTVFPKVLKLAKGKREIVFRRFHRAPVVFDCQRRPDGKGYDEVVHVKFLWTDILTPDSPLP